MVRIEIQQVENGWTVVGYLGQMPVKKSIASSPKEVLSQAEEIMTAHADWKQRMFSNQK